jgi:acetyltransferase
LSWKTASLERLFNPESIAIIGASNQPNKLGALTLRALSDFNARKFPVNPRHSTIDGLKCYFSVADIGDAIDLAIIALGPQHVLRSNRILRRFQGTRIKRGRTSETSHGTG